MKFIRIENLINHALTLDPNAKYYLKKLQRKSLAITLLTIEKIFFVSFTETNLILTRTEPPIIDVYIEGPLKAFINLAFTKNAHQAAQLGLHFKGDFNTVEAAQQLFLSLDIDWEEALSPWLGDSASHQLGQIVRHVKKRNAELLANTTESLAEYLKEETQILPTRIEINDFMEKVDLLRTDVERLEARILKLCETIQ